MRRMAWWRLALVLAVVAGGGVAAAVWLPGWSAATRDLVEAVSWCVTILSALAALGLWLGNRRQGDAGQAGTAESPSVSNSITGNVHGAVVMGANFGDVTLSTASTPPSPRNSPPQQS